MKRGVLVPFIAAAAMWPGYLLSVGQTKQIICRVSDEDGKKFHLIGDFLMEENDLNPVAAQEARLMEVMLSRERDPRESDRERVRMSSIQVLFSGIIVKSLEEDDEDPFVMVIRPKSEHEASLEFNYRDLWEEPVRLTGDCALMY